MKYKVIELFKVKTSQGELELTPTKLVTLQHDIAIRLLNEGKITPVERVTYKVYSELLGCHLWVVSDDKDRETIRASQGVSEAFYTGEEIRKLKGLDKDSLKVIHKVKEVFEGSKVEEITRKG